MITIGKLRDDFEDMAQCCHFDIERHVNGEYKTEGRNTFILWAGYWECARMNGVIDKNSDPLKMNDVGWSVVD